MSLLMVLADGILSNGAIHHCVAALAPDGGYFSASREVGRKRV